MGLLALLLVGFAAWMAFTGRLRRLTTLDGAMLGVSIVSAILAARGNPIIGGIPLALSALYALRRFSRTPPRPQPVATNEAVREARALLGVSPDADAEAIRAAHRRLIAKIHPDAGGTQALAEKINDARALLLRNLNERNSSQKPPSDSHS